MPYLFHIKGVMGNQFKSIDRDDPSDASVFQINSVQEWLTLTETWWLVSMVAGSPPMPGCCDLYAAGGCVHEATD